MELERATLDMIMDAVGDSPIVTVIDRIGDMTARLINRGNPAGYVVTGEGTFMVTVEMVSRTTMAVEP